MKPSREVVGLLADPLFHRCPLMREVDRRQRTWWGRIRAFFSR